MSETFLGPFGPVVGYGLALVNVVFLLRTLAAGRITIWKAPKDAASEGIVRVAAMLNVALLVGLWLFAAPNTLMLTVVLAFTGALGFLIAFLLYRQLMVTWTVRDAHGKDFLGGARLTGRAEKIRDEKGRTVQQLFTDACYNPELVWTPGSLAWTRTVITFLLVALLTSGTTVLAGAGFATQVKLTGRPAADVIQTAEAPASDPGRSVTRTRH